MTGQSARFLTFSVGENRYGISTETIAEVIPLVKIRRMPGLPQAIQGIIDYRGVLLPLIDLSIILQGESTPLRYSSRIVVVTGTDTQPLLAVLVGQAVELLELERPSLVEPPVIQAGMPFLREVSGEEGISVQIIDPVLIIDDETRSAVRALVNQDEHEVCSEPVES